MIIKEANQYGPLDESVLIKFEKKIKARLPEQYRNFLLKYNGGCVKPDCIDLPDGTGTLIHDYFYGLHNGEEIYNLEYELKIFKNRIPREMLPVLNDAGGNLFLIKIKGKDKGCIYFWDHESEGLPDAAALLASDFDTFLNNIHEYIPDDETLIDNIVRTQDINALTKHVKDGYSLEQENEYNRTIIEEAAIYGKYELFVWLSERGVSLRRSLVHAQVNKHKRIVDYIVAKYEKNKS